MKENLNLNQAQLDCIDEYLFNGAHEGTHEDSDGEFYILLNDYTFWQSEISKKEHVELHAYVKDEKLVKVMGVTGADTVLDFGQNTPDDEIDDGVTGDLETLFEDQHGKPY